ncbi:hypothetical protein [Acidovorax sp. BL-A-41-H1]|uniref:hypothetical protein n=1 Tax=Acidovorax sp. BL-A-41-H1 TaxID=3421102 RepID=UPI003F7B2D70
MSGERTPPAAWARWLVPIALAWLVVCGLLLVQLWPDLPRSRARWALLLAVGPPLYLLGEAGSAWLQAMAQRRAGMDKGFSWLRIVCALPVALVWFALCWLCASLMVA